MHVSVSSYTSFIFNLNTKQCYPQITHNDKHLHRYMYTHDDSSSTHPLLPGFTSVCPFSYIQPFFLLTWRSCFFCSWCEYPSTLVPGLLSTVLPLLLHPSQGTLQIKLHIYIDHINNISCPIWYSISVQKLDVLLLVYNYNKTSWQLEICKLSECKNILGWLRGERE